MLSVRWGRLAPSRGGGVRLALGATCAFQQRRRAPCIGGVCAPFFGALCAFSEGGLRLPSVAVGTLTVQVKGFGVGVVGHLG